MHTRHSLCRCVAVVGFALTATSCNKPAPQPSGAPPALPPTPVGVVTAIAKNVPEVYEFAGQVQPSRRTEVRSRVEGIVLERPFTEGSVVAKGDVLYRLDQVKYAAAYHAAEARFNQAKRTVDRLEPLIPKHAVAQQDVDNARSEMESAQAALDAAKKDLDDTVIRAETGGQVGRAQLQLGARVTGPADLLTTIDELDPVYVTFHPSSQQLLAWQQSASARLLIRPGSKLQVHVVLPDGSLLARTGELNFIAPSLDSVSGTQEFRATFANGDRGLLPGEFVRVRLEGFARENAIAIPQRAVQQGLGRQFVYVVGHGDSVVARDVTPGPWSGNLWIIDSGLSPGDTVIVDGIQKVAPGRIVKPMLSVDSSAKAPAGRRGGA